MIARRTEQTDLLYVNAKELIHIGRIQIRVASVSSESFRHLSAFYRGRLTSYINIQHLFDGAIFQMVSFRLWMDRNFFFGGEI